MMGGPAARLACGWEVWAMLGHASREAGGPHSSCGKSAPGDVRGSLHDVCPNSAWIPARTGKLSFS